MDPLVSVVMIFLNAEQFIEEAIESVFAQTYGRWELLLVDDGSGDASTAIARRYAAADPARVRYLEHPAHENRGMSASRNQGIRHANGELIAFLDADDVWLKHKLAEQVRVLMQHPRAGMAYGETEYWSSWSDSSQTDEHDYVQHHGITANALYEPPRLLELYLRGRASIPPPSSVILRRDVFSKIGYLDESFRGLYEDQALYVKVCLQEPVFVASACWDRYRQHPASSCAVAAQGGGHEAARLAFLHWVQAYLAQRGMVRHLLNQVVQQARWEVEHPKLARFHRFGRRRLNRISRLVSLSD